MPRTPVVVSLQAKQTMQKKMKFSPSSSAAAVQRQGSLSSVTASVDCDPSRQALHQAIEESSSSASTSVTSTDHDEKLKPVLTGELGEEAEVMSEDDRYPLEGDDEDMSTTDAEKGDEGSGLQRRRKKRPCVLLTDEQERMLGDWLQEHPFLYDRGLTDFKKVAKKKRLLTEKARSLDPPLTGPQLSTWLKSIRTRYGRLTKGKSGQAAQRGLTEREKWILSEFKFFGKHIVRQKKPRTVGLKESAAAAAAAPPEEPGEVVVSAGGDKDEVTVSPATEGQRPQRKQKFDPVRQEGKGFVLEKVAENAETVKKVILGEIESNRKEAYWNLHLKKVAKDCAEIDPVFYPYLQTEIGFLVQKLQKATKEGRLTASFDLFPSTRQTFLEMERHSSTGSFPSHPPGHI
ncbi:uncharacterized protein [Macrobrachium rosenbergii]|uniref:uncharacterized protein n=1 Tax=Macrobrachium rosenbergii TaxID=79674 RepID=UPI0034D4F1A4